MLTITVELLHGTIRSTGPEDAAITGNVTDPEWPPSPARLFSALVASGGSADRLPVDRADLHLLEEAPPPEIVADSLANVLISPVGERFVVADRTHIDNQTRQTAAVQEYPGRTSVPVRPGTRIAPRVAEVTYVWSELDLDPAAMHRLKWRASRVSYLGCSDSPVRVTVADRMPREGDRWVPDDAGPTVLPVATPGLLTVLDEFYARFQEGEPVRRAWIPIRSMRYRPPGAVPIVPALSTVVWVRFDPPVAGRHLRNVTETLRAALLERYTLEIGGDWESVPGTITGHGFQGTGYQHAYYLALPDAGHPHARGRLHGGAVVLPPGCPSDVVETVRASLWRMTNLTSPGVFTTRLRLYGGEPSPVAATPQRWLGPASHWVSVTPAVQERFQRGDPDLREMARWCMHAGVLTPLAAARWSRQPLIDGALTLAPSEVHRTERERRPYGHLSVRFSSPVRGPLVLGGARQFGFGLMLPLTSGDASGG